jgi:hypothetical protein
MVRILHVSNFSLRAKGAFLHKVEHKISNGLIRNGHQAINFSDRDAARANSLLGSVKGGGQRAANRALASFCRQMRPDVLFLGHGDVIEPETIGQLRDDQPSLRVLQWNVDPMFEADNVRRLISKLDVVDATLVSTAGEALAPLRRPGKLLGFLPNPVDFSIERGRNHEIRDLPYDLFYACGDPARPPREVCGRDWNMNDFMSALIGRLPGLRVLAPGIDGAPNLGGDACQAAMESAAIGLNISRRDDVLLYTSDRLAQMCGNGQAILIARSTGYDSLFSDEEMVFFDSVDGLVEAIRALVADPERRMRIATAGRARYHALFNERIVAAYMLDVALDRLDPSAYGWPTLLS